MLSTPRPIVLAVLIALVAVALVLPFFVGTYGIKFATRVMVIAILVVSLDFLIGITGLVSFGHAMFLGLGAYTLYFISPKAEAVSAFIAIPAMIVAAAICAAAIGAIVVLARGFYFIMVTLAFGQMLFSLFHDTDIAGGSDGAYINFVPQFHLGDWLVLDFGNRWNLYYFCLAALVASYLFLLWLTQSPVGRVLQGIRHNEARMSALGFNTYAYKLVSFTVAGALGGLAGGLFASIDGYVTPELFGWRESGLAIMMVVLGGTGTLYGPILGTVLFSMLEEVLRSSAIVGALVADHWLMALGFVLIALVLLAPRGIAGLLERDRTGKTAVEPVEAKAPLARNPQPGKELATEGLTRRFGGLVAVNEVTVGFKRNRVHGIIGPNGAGKTTLINLLSGVLPPTAGSIRLDGEEIAGQRDFLIARRGLGRSYQRTNILLPFTVGENCQLAAQARHPQPWRISDTAYWKEEEAAVVNALQAAGLADRRHVRAAHLSHGEQRQLEIAMLIASGARLLILDEPLAGMGPEETARVVALLRDLAIDHTVILIEHDMDAIFAAADTLSVLVEGKLIAHGTPDEIRRDPAVRAAYLGRYGDNVKVSG